MINTHVSGTSQDVSMLGYRYHAKLKFLWRLCYLTLCWTGLDIVYVCIYILGTYPQSNVNAVIWLATLLDI